MPTKYVRRGSDRREWSIEDLKKAAQAVDEKLMGVNAAAKTFGISKTTLKRRIKSNDFTFGSMGKCSVLGYENEKKMVAHIKKLQSHGFTPTRESVRLLAFELAEKLNLNHTFNKEKKIAGNDWLVSFLARNPELSIRQSEAVSIARAKSLNKNICKEYFNLLNAVLTENNLINKPGNVFNMDETGLQLNNKAAKVIAVKGSKNVTTVTSGEKGETISVVACVNGEGTFLPPYAIMKGKNLKQEFCDGMPPGSKVKMSQKSAYINTDIFFDWLKNHFYPRKPPGKVLLLLDGHTSHTSSLEVLEFAEKNDILLMSIPPHTSHWLQPLDRSFFKSLKAHFYTACGNYIVNNPSRKISRLQFGTLLSAGWGKSATVSNGISGFKTCGIIPFDPSAIPDYAFLAESSNIVENVENLTACTENEIEKDSPTINLLPTAGPSGISVQELSKKKETPTKLLDKIHPVPNVDKLQKLNRKSRTISTVLSSPEYIATLKKKKENEDLKCKRKWDKISKKKCSRMIIQKSKKSEDKENICGNKKRNEADIDSSNSSISFEYNEEDEDNSFSNMEQDVCMICRDFGKDELWFSCAICRGWVHAACSELSPAEAKRKTYICDFCK